MSTPTVDRRLTLDDIDEVLRHWASKLHTDPDPINRWAYLNVCNAWLDARLAAERNQDQDPPER
jgi:hypothetical protein